MGKAGSFIKDKDGKLIENMKCPAMKKRAEQKAKAAKAADKNGVNNEQG